MTKAFWRGFWEGANPACWLAMASFWAGCLVSRTMNRWHALGWLYPVYSRLMLWSWAVQQRCGLNGPWREVA
jgi:hypothetical protein